MRLGIVVTLTGALLIGLAAPASAHASLHAELIASNPANGSSLVAAPSQVQLTFNQAVSIGDNAVQVTGPGVAWTVGPATVAGAVVTAPVTADGAAGLYTLSYQVVSGDGDPVTGSITFTMTAPVVPTTTTTTSIVATALAPPPAEQAAPEEDDGGVPVWVWLAVAVIVVAAAAVVVVRQRRRS